MNELTQRLRALRTSVKLDDVFDKQPSTAEFKKSCTVVELGYAKM